MGSVPMDRSRKWGGGAHMEAWAELTWLRARAAKQPSRASSSHRLTCTSVEWVSGSVPGAMALPASPAARALRGPPGVESDARPRTPPRGCGRPEIRGVGRTF